MAKKQRRKQSQKGMRQPIQAAAARQAATVTGEPAATAAAQPAAPQPRTPEPARKQKAVATWAEHAQRYTYVNQELKSIGILAGSFLVILLILSAILS
jgi:hypothetical protein